MIWHWWWTFFIFWTVSEYTDKYIICLFVLCYTARSFDCQRLSNITSVSWRNICDTGTTSKSEFQRKPSSFGYCRHLEVNAKRVEDMRTISSFPTHHLTVHRFGAPTWPPEINKTSGVHFFYKSSFFSLENYHTCA